MPRFSTPYYLAGRSAERWHRNEGNKAMRKAAVVGGTGFVVNRKPDAAAGHLNKSGFIAGPGEVKKGGTALMGVGAATAAYGGYHYKRAAGYEKRLRTKGRGVGQQRTVGYAKYDKTEINKALNNQWYERTVKDKKQKVKKGKRK